MHRLILELRDGNMSLKKGAFPFVYTSFFNIAKAITKTVTFNIFVRLSTSNLFKSSTAAIITVHNITSP